MPISRGRWRRDSRNTSPLRWRAERFDSGRAADVEGLIHVRVHLRVVLHCPDGQYRAEQGRVFAPR